MILTTKSAGTREVWTLEEMAAHFKISRQGMTNWLKRRPKFAADIEIRHHDQTWAMQIWENDSFEEIRKARKK